MKCYWTPARTLTINFPSKQCDFSKVGRVPDAWNEKDYFTSSSNLAGAYGPMSSMVSCMALFQVGLVSRDDLILHTGIRKASDTAGKIAGSIGHRKSRLV